MNKYYWIAALAIGLAACQSTPGPITEDAQQPVVEPEAPQASAIEADSQEIQVAPETQEPEALDAEQAVEASPTPVRIRQGLAATDPSSVNLANGSPTFVEFFAFW